jgi:hypothetical protein
MNINKLKQKEMQEIKDFCRQMEEYGHIFYLDPKLLDEPFNKILEGIKEIQQMMKDSFEM